MRRRKFITLVVGAAAAWPLAAHAKQAAKVARVGYLATGSRESPEAWVFLDAFRRRAAFGLPEPARHEAGDG